MVVPVLHAGADPARPRGPHAVASPAGANKSEVLAKVRLRMAKSTGGVIFDDSLTLGEFMERWLHDSAKGSVKPITFEQYRRQTRLHRIPVLGSSKLPKLTPANVQSPYQRKLDEGLSPHLRPLYPRCHQPCPQASSQMASGARECCCRHGPPEVADEDHEFSRRGTGQAVPGMRRVGTGCKPCSWWPSLPGCASEGYPGCVGNTWTLTARR